MSEAQKYADNQSGDPQARRQMEQEILHAEALQNDRSALAQEVERDGRLTSLAGHPGGETLLQYLTAERLTTLERLAIEQNPEAIRGHQARASVIADLLDLIGEAPRRAQEGAERLKRLDEEIADTQIFLSLEGEATHTSP